MNAQDLIAQLAQETKLFDLKLDENGCARLVFDQSINIDIEHVQDENQLVLYAVLELPQTGDNRSAVLEKLLKANYFGRGTGGAVFSLDPWKNDILLTKTLDLNHCDWVEFSNALDSLVNAVEHWQAELTAAPTQPAGFSPVASGIDPLLLRA